MSDQWSPADELSWTAAYDARAFPPFALTVDLNVFTIRDGVLCVLLVERAEPPFLGRWALPGGHVAHGRESADAAAVRRLREETGLDWPSGGGHLEQVRTYSDPARDPRIDAGLHVASVAYVALAPHLPDPRPGSGASRAVWTPVDRVEPPLAFDHALILGDALERVRAKLEYTTLATQFVEEPFSLNELRRVYAAVWGVAPEPANFRRKVLSTTGFVQPAERAGGAPSEHGGRPPQLYRRGDALLLHPAMLRPRPPA